MAIDPTDAPPAVAWFESYSGFIKFLAFVAFYLCAQAVIPSLSEVVVRRVARLLKEYRLQIGCHVQALPKPRSHLPDCAIPFPVYDGLRCISAKIEELREPGNPEIEAVSRLLDAEEKIAGMEEGFRTGVLRRVIFGLPCRVWACLTATYMMYVTIPAAVATCEMAHIEDLLSAA